MHSVPTIDAADAAREVEAELELRVWAKEEIAVGVFALTLRAADAGELPPWRPGAHIDVLLPGDMVRQYSLCGDPADAVSWRIAVLREPDGRGGSAFIADTLVEGDTLAARGPRNHFELADADALVFIAGGVGITPILPMIAEADRRGTDWRLHYGGRARASMAFAPELAQRYGERVRLYPEDEVGLIDLASALDARDAGAPVYCCGPEPLIAAVEGRLANDTQSLRVERFAARELAPTTGLDTFHVICAQSEVEFDVGPDQSIVEAAETAGVYILTSCCEGTCGTCESAVVSGVPDHRDSVLSAAERKSGKTMCPCVSRALTETLELDI